VPVADVNVEVFSQSGNFVGSTRTDSTGRYLTQGIPAGQHYARTSNSKGYLNQLYQGMLCVGCAVTAGTPIGVLAGGTVGSIDFALSIGAGTVSGTVLDRQTGSGVANVNVNFYDNSGNWVSSGYTDTTGRYLSNTLPPGLYYARTSNTQGYINTLFPDISCPPCAFASGTAVPVLAGGETNNVNFLIAPHGAQIRGRVTQAGSSAGIGGVNVNVYDDAGRLVASALTTADGTYIGDGGLPAGTYFARTLNALGYPDLVYSGIPCASCDVRTGTPIVVGEGAIRADIDFQLNSSAVINFEDLPDSMPPTPLPISYQGVTWTNWLTYAPYSQPYQPDGINALYAAADAATFAFRERAFLGAWFSRYPQAPPGDIFFELYHNHSLVWVSAPLADTSPQLTFLPSGYAGPVDEVRVRSLGNSMTALGSAWIMDDVSFGASP
jgi:hypothetical protein